MVAILILDPMCSHRSFAKGPCPKRNWFKPGSWKNRKCHISHLIHTGPCRLHRLHRLHLKMAQALKVTMSKENLVWKHIVAISLHLWNLVNPKAKLKSLVIPGGDVELFYQPKTSLEKKHGSQHEKCFTRQPASQDWLFEKKQLSIHRRRIKVSENMRRCKKKNSAEKPERSKSFPFGDALNISRYVPQIMGQVCASKG